MAGRGGSVRFHRGATVHPQQRWMQQCAVAPAHDYRRRGRRYADARDLRRAEIDQQPPRRLPKGLPPIDRPLLRPTGMWVTRRLAFLALAKHRAQLEVEDAGADAASTEIEPEQPRHGSGPEHDFGEMLVAASDRLEHSWQFGKR